MQSAAGTLEYQRPYLYPKQSAAFFHNKRYGLTEASTKAGKTVAAIAWIIERALMAPVPHQNFWWVAPVSEQARIAYSRIKNGLTRGTFTSAESPTPKITLINNATIWFKSGDNPDSLYGEDVYAAVIDEASRCKEESWFALRSTLTATQGPVNIIGNVKGRKNWFYRLARQAEAGAPNMNYAHITVLDAIAAGVIPADEVEDAKRTLPERVFRELYMAEPADDAGNPFGLDHIAACIGPLSDGPAVAFGLDLAKKHDWVVLIGLDAEGKTCCFQRWQGVPWRETIRRVHAIVGEDVPCLVDSTGVGDPVLEELQVGHSNFAGFTFSSTSKQRLMEGLAVSIQGHEIRYPEGPISTELEIFEYELTRTGVRYAAPEGEFDDCVCALALAREQWSTSAPAQNLMAYYAGELQRAKRTQEARDILPERSLIVDDLGLGRDEQFENELTSIYNETLAQYQPAGRLCHGCGKKIEDPSRVSDGVYVWHAACFGVRRAA